MKLFSRCFLAQFSVFVLITVVAAPASAKQKPITASLSKSGYTVIALAANGKAAKAKGTKIKLTPPAAKVTLHLVAPSGKYAGPIVVAGKGKQAVVGVKAGAKLGKVTVKSGYAKPAGKLKVNSLDKSRTATAKNGVPVGAKVYGLVSSKSSKGGSGTGRDRDLDGIPGAFDIDDDGDLVLDNFDSSAGASVFAFAAAGPQPPVGPPVPGGPGSAPGGPQAPGAPLAGPDVAGGQTLRVFSNLKLELAKSLNANASTVTDEQIDQAVSENQTLAIQVAPGDSVELDCGGLTYCSKGGTGRNLSAGSPTSSPAFPDAFDSDGDGFGTVGAGSTGDFQLLTGAKSGAIGSGDTLTEIVSSGGKETLVPGVLNFAFITTPGLTSWSSGSNGGTIGYPATNDSPGSMNNGLPVAASGDVTVTLTFWRPQRRAVPGAGEGGGFVDIGKLNYTADIPNAPVGPGSQPSNGVGNCSSSAYSTSDPNLKVGTEGVEDQAEDRPSDPANTLTFSVNLTQCLAARGIQWNSGESLAVDIQARSKDGDNAAQKIVFKRQ